MCERWDLPVAVIGRVTAEPDIVVLTGPDGAGALDGDGRPVAGARELARIPAAALASGAIVFQRESRAPTRRRAAPAPGAPSSRSTRCRVRGQDPGAVLLALLGSPNLSSRRAVFEQYDHNVQANTVAGPGRGAAVLRIKGTTKALVASTDANAPVGALDPWLGAAMSVVEAARNVAITGARPLGVTNCLNFGDPTRPEAFWQLTEAVRGLSDACIALGLPVTGGNVSLYNESPGSAIAPTPEIGVVGLLDDVAKRVGPAFRGDGNAGPAGRARRAPGSPAASTRGSRAPRPKTARPRSTSRSRRASRRSSARPSTAASSRAARTSPAAGSRSRSPRWRSGAGTARSCGSRSATRRRSGLFGESPSRGSSSRSAPRHVPAFILLARQHGLPGDELGTTGGSRLVIELAGEGATGRRRGAREPDRRCPRRRGRDLRHAWEHGLPRALGWEETPDVWCRRRRPARSRPRGRRRRRHRAVRAPAPRPGVGRRGGVRRAAT